MIFDLFLPLLLLILLLFLLLFLLILHILLEHQMTQQFYGITKLLKIKKYVVMQKYNDGKCDDDKLIYSTSADSKSQHNK